MNYVRNVLKKTVFCLCKLINLRTISIVQCIESNKINTSVASTKETTLIGRISYVVRSGRGPDFVA